MDFKWRKRVCEIAWMVARWSKDPEQVVGAVIVSPDMRQFSMGYNGFPRGINDSSFRLGSVEIKNPLMVHAELNAILNASADLRGWTMASTKFPCAECSKAIIQAGIVAVIVPEIDNQSKWADSQLLGKTMLLEARIGVLDWPL